MGRKLSRVLVVIAFLAVPSASAAAPANDNFADATQISGSPAAVTGTNRGATAEPAEPAHHGSPSGTVWYSWIADGSGTVSFHTCTSDFDSVVAVYTGTTLSGLTQRGSDNNGCSFGYARGARVQLAVTGGTRYWIAVDGYFGDQGWFTLTLDGDVTPPPRPSFTTVDPPSPSNEPFPRIGGFSEQGSTVRLYSSFSLGCDQMIGIGSAESFGGPGIEINAASARSDRILATATDAAGNVSECTGDHGEWVSYSYDGTAPPAPTLTGTSPPSPSSVGQPRVRGNAGGGDAAWILVFTNSACGGNPDTTGVPDEFQAAGIPVGVPHNSTTQLSVAAADHVGNRSLCSNAASYTHDSQPPSPPMVSATDPQSPSNINTPKVTGSAEPGSTVTLHSDASCTSPVLGSGSASAFSSPGIAVTVPDNSTTTFRARATDALGNVSACSSTSVSYLEDSQPTTAPTITATDPSSPSGTDTTPKVIGTASAETDAVTVYASSNCGGPVAGNGTRTAFSGAGIEVSVVADATTPLSARAVDEAGNLSACSNSLGYRHDSQPPNAPTFSATSPTSPSPTNNPRLIGSAEPGSTIRIYADPACASQPASSGVAAAFGFPGLSVSVPADSTTIFRATATDDVGNTSPCSISSITYQEDSTPPPRPELTGTDPVSPSSTDTSLVVLGAAEDAVRVRLFANGACLGQGLGLHDPDELAGRGIPQEVEPNTTTSYSLEAIDEAGNTSACSAAIRYVHDSNPPPAPVMISTDPASPANDNAPHIVGRAEDGATVQLYSDDVCDEPIGPPASAEVLLTTGIEVEVANDTVTRFRAIATDELGNVSDCSHAAVAYVEDSSPPGAPLITTSHPASPSRTTTAPMVAGLARRTTETVRLFGNANCTGSATEGGAEEFEEAGIEVVVPPNATTRIAGRALDQAGNASPCSQPLAYTHDDLPPAAPSLTGTDPSSPADYNRPKVLGTAEAGSSVSIFAEVACTSPTAIVTGSSSQLLVPGLEFEVPDNSTTPLSATATDPAGNASACSNTISYQEVSTQPPPPPPGPSAACVAATRKLTAATTALRRAKSALRRAKRAGAPPNRIRRLRGVVSAKRKARARAQQVKLLACA